MSYLPEKRIHGGINADEMYWESLGAEEFRLSRCGDCREWLWPAHWRCGKCGSWDIIWEQLEPQGRIWSWTRTWYVFDQAKARAGDIPYVTALMEIPEAGNVRVLGILEGNEDGLKIGASVVGAFRAASEKSHGYPSLVWRLSPPGQRTSGEREP